MACFAPSSKKCILFPQTPQKNACTKRRPRIGILKQSCHHKEHEQLPIICPGQRLLTKCAFWNLLKFDGVLWGCHWKHRATAELGLRTWEMQIMLCTFTCLHNMQQTYEWVSWLMSDQSVRKASQQLRIGAQGLKRPLCIWAYLALALMAPTNSVYNLSLASPPSSPIPGPK